MGYQLLTRARWHARKLRSKNATLVLLEMANTAKDDDDPPLFWRHWETLAISIGFDLPPPPDPDRLASGDPAAKAAHATRKTALNAVAKAQRDLQDAGLIVRTTAKSPGRPTVWRLALDLLVSPESRGTEQSRKSRDDSPATRRTTVPKDAGQEEPEGPIRNNAEDSTPRRAASTDRARSTRPIGIHRFQADEHGHYCTACECVELHPNHHHWKAPA